jgi:hypothetical protein
MNDIPATRRMRELAGELRERDKVILDLEEALSREKGRVRAITTSELVDLMHELDLTSFNLAAEGNLPAMSFEMGNHYAASISKDWEEERRERAFDALPDDLIKVTVSALFAKGEAQQASDLADELVTAGYTVVIEKTVHHSTLKAWVREQFENGNELPNLETIGASIFNEVKVKEIKP